MKTRLISLFLPAIRRTLAVYEMPSNQRPAPTTLIAELRGLLPDPNARHDPASRWPQADIKEATEAIVAWIDDLFGVDHAWWPQENRLQKAMFNVNSLGDDFYEKLHQCPPEKREVREVYFTALGLGFAGTYAISDPDGRGGHVKREKQNLVPSLPTTPVAGTSIIGGHHIHSQPYDIANPPPHPPVRRAPLWPYALAGLAAVALLGAGLFWLLYDPAGDLRARVADAVTGLSCAHLQTRLDEKQVVHLEGYGQNAAQLSDLTRRLEAIQGVTAVRSTATVEPPPYCTLQQVLDTETNARGGIPAILIAGGDRAFADGAELSMKVTTGAGAGYLTVIGIDSDGAVAHMYPYPHADRMAEPAAVLAPATDITVASPAAERTADDEVGFTLPADRLGRNLIVALWSPQPLFPTARQNETVESFIPVLKTRLAALRAEGVTVQSNRHLLQLATPAAP
ncbi:DotU family type IV/VI secretion system protein [Niveispirillum irakense]|uniref:DotU family type IV/VI secretion system protein n=1 Tax=Niveispirillum irakense TaxID=34011 RepID=UPI0003FBC4C8|nr:DotU family type IV/VI secretion system protein [Niveispirillum irakense]